MIALVAARHNAGVRAVEAASAPIGARPSRSVEIGGYAMFGRISFTAVESFDAILGEPSGPICRRRRARRSSAGRGLFVDVGAWRFHGEGERAFVFNDEVIPLGIPVDVTMTPIEMSAGWRFRLRRMPKLLPYVAGGFTSMTYQETLRIRDTAEDVDETFNGYHVLGGARVQDHALAGRGRRSGVDDGARCDRRGRRVGSVQRKRSRRHDLPVQNHDRTMTPFERRVLTLVSRIPVGRVTTYGDIARLAGQPGAARAVGNIMRAGRSARAALSPGHRCRRARSAAIRACR